MVPELTQDDVQRQVGALTLQLWAAWKHIADLERRVAALTPTSQQPQTPTPAAGPQEE